jgi:hypothetical protein
LTSTNGRPLALYTWEFIEGAEYATLKADVLSKDKLTADWCRSGGAGGCPEPEESKAITVRASVTLANALKLDTVRVAPLHTKGSLYFFRLTITSALAVVSTPLVHMVRIRRFPVPQTFIKGAKPLLTKRSTHTQISAGACPPPPPPLCLPCSPLCLSSSSLFAL